MSVDRSEILDRLSRHPEIPVLIVGAGVNGIGTFRDLALQGVDVLMVDRADFCSGASAASSHMVHGGIRYLENGEFRLVREAVGERNHFLRNAPHYVKPLPTTFPIFKLFSGLLNAPLKFLGLLDRPAERGALVIKIGMTLYDAYAGTDRVLPRHVFRSRRESLETFPNLNPEVRFTATYYDGAMPSPERICMDLIRDARADHPGALALNYMPVIGAHADQVTLRDKINGSTYTVKPQVVVNAAGPWIDVANQAMGRESDFIGGTKGSHLVLDHPKLRASIRDHEFFFENKDGRIVLIFPLLDKVLIGTSDIRIDDPDEARCTEEEIGYFFDMIGRVFPKIEVRREHIVYRFSGVRPLPSSPEGLTGSISRDHSVEALEPGDGLTFPILSLVGGKWTSYRAFAAQVSAEVLSRLDLPRERSTRDLPIGGGEGFPVEDSDRLAWLRAVSQETGVPEARLATLLERYGTVAREVAAFLSQGPDAPLEQERDYSRREILYLIEKEWALHLEDIVLRRTLLGKLGQLTPELLGELAQIAGAALNWTEAQQRQEQAGVNRLIESP
jgi:glycerol-3-phosphate dehydrogenase